MTATKEFEIKNFEIEHVQTGYLVTADVNSREDRAPLNFFREKIEGGNDVSYIDASNFVGNLRAGQGVWVKGDLLFSVNGNKLKREQTIYN